MQLFQFCGIDICALKDHFPTVTDGNIFGIFEVREFFSDLKILETLNYSDSLTHNTIDSISHHSTYRQVTSFNKHFHATFFKKCFTYHCCQLLRLCSVGDRWVSHYGALLGSYWQGKTEVFKRQTCPSATLTISNPMWTTHLGSNRPPHWFNP